MPTPLSLDRGYISVDTVLALLADTGSEFDFRNPSLKKKKKGRGRKEGYMGPFAPRSLRFLFLGKDLM